MKTTTLKCTSCGAPLKLREGSTTATCTYCGSTIIIERDNRHDTPKTVKKYVDNFEDATRIVHDVVREKPQNTLDETQRLRMQNDVANTKIQLSQVHSEIREILRKETSSRAKKQIKSLRTTEYTLMEKIRQLENQLLQPDPSDLSAYIAWAEREKSIIEAEIRSLKDSDENDSLNIIKGLLVQEQALDNRMTASKVRLLIKDLPSFQNQEIDMQNATDIPRMLTLLSVDEAEVRKIHKTIEGKIVADEILRRKNDYHLALKDLKKGYTSDIQGSTLELNSADFSEDYITSKKKSISLSGFAGNSTGVKSVKKGLLYGFLTFIGFAFLASIFVGILMEIIPELSDDFGSSISYIFLPIGFFFAARAFLLNAVPDLTLRGIAGLPDLTLESWKSGTAIKSLTGVKLLVGAIVFHQVYLMFMFPSVVISPIHEAAASAVLNVGFFVGIGAGIIAAIQTVFSADI